MADATTVRPPKWFWIAASIAFVWNLMGVAAYLMQVTMSDETLAALPAEQQALYASTPAWATGAFALAVFGGALGCLFLLLRKSWAQPLFVVSLVGILLQNVHSFFLSKSWEVFGPGGVIMPMMVVVIACYLIWLARRSQGEGWIN